MKDKPYGVKRSKYLRLLSLLAVFLLVGFFCIAPVSAADVLQIPVPSGNVVEGVNPSSPTDLKSSVIVKSLPSEVMKGSPLTISGFAAVADSSLAVVTLKSPQGAAHQQPAIVNSGSFKVTFETVSMAADTYTVSVTVAGKTSDVGTVKIVEPTVYTQAPVKTETPIPGVTQVPTEPAPVYTQAPISSKPINEKVTKGSTLTLSGTTNTGAVAGEVYLVSNPEVYEYIVTITYKGSWTIDIDTSEMDVGVYTIYVRIAGTESILGTVEIVEPTPVYTQSPVETETPVPGVTQVPTDPTPTITVNPYPASVPKGSILEISGTVNDERAGVTICLRGQLDVTRMYSTSFSISKNSWTIDIDTSDLNTGRYYIHAMVGREKIDIGTVDIVEPKPTDPTPTPTPTATETGKPKPTGSAVEKPVDTQKDYEKADESEDKPAGVPAIITNIVNWFKNIFTPHF